MEHQDVSYVDEGAKISDIEDIVVDLSLATWLGPLQNAKITARDVIYREPSGSLHYANPLHSGLEKVDLNQAAANGIRDFER